MRERHLVCIETRNYRSLLAGWVAGSSCVLIRNSLAGQKTWFLRAGTTLYSTPAIPSTTFVFYNLQYCVIATKSFWQGLDWCLLQRYRQFNCEAPWPESKCISPSRFPRSLHFTPGAVLQHWVIFLYKYIDILLVRKARCRKSALTNGKYEQRWSA